MTTTVFASLPLTQLQESYIYLNKWSVMKMIDNFSVVTILNRLYYWLLARMFKNIHKMKLQSINIIKNDLISKGELLPLTIELILIIQTYDKQTYTYLHTNNIYAKKYF